MQRRISILEFACVCTAAALLAGCSGSGGSQIAPSASGLNAVRQTAGGGRTVDLVQTLVTPRSVRPRLHRHAGNVRFVKPNCCGLQKTLFASDAFGGSSYTGAIYTFDYVTGAYLGQVEPPPEGFLEVQGGCSDNGGNVYFANTALSTVDEYNHSGTYVATLPDPGQFPAGCSFDRTTGNLAVSNITSASGGPGSISIFNGGVVQNTYFPPNMARVYFLGYEGNSGTLWLDGLNSSEIFQYDSFRGGSFTNVGVHGVSNFLFPGTVQWSEKTKAMNVGDQLSWAAPTTYQVDNNGNVIGETVFACGHYCEVVDAAIKGPGIVGPDAFGLVVLRYAYPAGGSSILEYDVPGGYIDPIGAAISPNK